MMEKTKILHTTIANQAESSEGSIREVAVSAKRVPIKMPFKG